MSTVTVEVSKELVQPIIEEKIKAAIIEGMGDQKAVIEMLVDRVLKDKVQHDGTKSRYESDNRYSMIDMVIQKAIHAAAQEAIAEYIAARQADIKKELIRQLQTTKGATRFAAALLEAAEKGTKNKTTFSLSIGFAPPGKDDLSF